jgi:hypothetical protein
VRGDGWWQGMGAGDGETDVRLCGSHIVATIAIGNFQTEPLSVRRLACGTWDCSKWDCGKWDCSKWDCGKWVRRLACGTYSMRSRNCFCTTTPTSFRRFLRLMSSSTLSPVDLVTHCANYVRLALARHPLLFQQGARLFSWQLPEY